jgi:hypothetical protein
MKFNGFIALETGQMSRVFVTITHRKLLIVSCKNGNDAYGHAYRGITGCREDNDGNLGGDSILQARPRHTSSHSKQNCETNYLRA